MRVQPEGKFRLKFCWVLVSLFDVLSLTFQFHFDFWNGLDTITDNTLNRLLLKSVAIFSFDFAFSYWHE